MWLGVDDICTALRFTQNATIPTLSANWLLLGGFTRSDTKETMSASNEPGPGSSAKKMRLDDQSDCSLKEPGTPCIPAPHGSVLDEKEYEKLLQTLVDANPYIIPVWPTEIDGKPVPLNIDTLMQYGGFVELRLIIDWAKHISGFRNLKLEDQMSLLKASFLELNVLRLSFRTMKYESSKQCCFAENLLLGFDEATNLGWGLDLVNCTLEFSRCLNELDIDKVEFAILCAIVLSFPDAAGVQNKDAVTDLQRIFLDILRQYILKQYPGDKHRYGKLLLKLPLLRTTSAKAAERFLKMTLDGTIQLNNLVWEMMS